MKLGRGARDERAGHENALTGVGCASTARGGGCASVDRQCDRWATGLVSLPIACNLAPFVRFCDALPKVVRKRCSSCHGLEPTVPSCEYKQNSSGIQAQTLATASCCFASRHKQE